MKATYLYKILPLVAAALAATCTKSAAQRAGAKNGPRPVVEYSSITYPGEAFNPKAEGYAEPKVHGYVFLKDGKALPGNVKVSGTITSIDKGKIELAGNGRKHTMLYALPTGMQLPVKPGEEMSVHLRRGGEGRGGNFTTVSNAGSTLLHASGRSRADAPVRIPVAEGLEVYQQTGVAGAHVPVLVSYKGMTTEISSKGITAVDIDGQPYNALVVVSMNMPPTNPDAVACQLEFVMVRQ